ncbi:MAG: polyhydroxyalkanoate synthesis repressor PhaR [Alphaproteobacteria bacterium]|nr:polyhydroxyalkanoate synthesis repressor PhaR [Alphaproteobacteria bacterium]
MSKTKRGVNEPTIVKKYANRRLYDTGRSSYVTLNDLCDMLKEGHDFVVLDAKSSEDITRSVLTQIIVDQESNGDENLLPTGFLKNLISFYGNNMQGLLPNYLEGTLDVFIKNQEQLREQLNKSFSGMKNMNNMNNMFPTSTAAIEEMKRQNVAMFEQAMKMFTPFNSNYKNDLNNNKK